VSGAVSAKAEEGDEEGGGTAISGRVQKPQHPFIMGGPRAAAEPTTLFPRKFTSPTLVRVLTTRKGGKCLTLDCVQCK
jgi:hypothetical protein